MEAAELPNKFVLFEGLADLRRECPTHARWPLNHAPAGSPNKNVCRRFSRLWLLHRPRPALVQWAVLLPSLGLGVGLGLLLSRGCGRAHPGSVAVPPPPPQGVSAAEMRSLAPVRASAPLRQWQGTERKDTDELLI